MMIVESGGYGNGSDDHDCGLDGNEGDGGDGKIYFFEDYNPTIIFSPHKNQL